MQKIKRFFGQKTNRIAGVAFFLIFIIMGVICSFYYLHLQKTVKGESHEYLQELSKLLASNTSRNIKDNFSVLGTISTVLKSSNVTTFEELQPIVLAQQNYWNYKNLLLIDGNGNAMDAYGGTTMLSGDASVRDVILNNARTMSPCQLINGSECILFAMPVDNLTIGGIKVYALAATYELSTFDKILSMTAFSGHGYAHIIKKDGSVVARSSSVYAAQTGYNILNSLSDAQFDDAVSIEQVRGDIEKGRTGVVSYAQNDVDYYMAYTPLDMQEWYVLAFVPVSVVNAKSNLLIQLTLLLCATITLAFAFLIAYILFSNARHKKKLEIIAYVDPVTGGNTIQRFYEEAQRLVSAPNALQYAIVYSNIEKFKILNEEFGRRACDEMLTFIHTAIQESLSPSECMGRLSADNFCVLMQYAGKGELEVRLETWHDCAVQLQRNKDGVWLSPVLSFGVYVISNTSLEFPQMIDRAKLALREQTTELRGKLHYAMYDDEIHRRLLREKHLEDMMEESLKSHEFEVYLQPKYCADSETIGGAEALVRWNSASDGMIYPDEFISLFEKNGFIVQLDLWVFEQVCRSIRGWLEAGKEPAKVSVNCSRIHLKNPTFLDNYLQICKRCNTPTRYIEIELTENIVFEDVEHLSKTINDIHKAGFGCSMDDFGSGYSSLNLIQDIPVDTIKLDKVFFRKIDALERTESVVGSIIRMSQSLQMKTVAEGVEERVQVDMLKRLGCDLIQGYYFARPMPIAKFEELAFGVAITQPRVDSAVK